MPTPKDEAVSLAASVMGVRGGQKGGRATTPEKTAAARENGKLGGRPKGSKNLSDRSRAARARGKKGGGRRWQPALASECCARMHDLTRQEVKAITKYVTFAVDANLDTSDPRIAAAIRDARWLATVIDPDSKAATGKTVIDRAMTARIDP